MTSQMISTYSNSLPSASDWQLLKEQAQSLLVSGYLPKGITKPEQVILIMLKGRELNIPPLQALSHIHVINGKPCMSAELMLAQIYRLHPKTVFKFKERSNERCILEAKRENHGVETFQWSIDDARKAGLLQNPTWNKYPRAMLHARVVSEMARSLFPDAIAGVSYTPEEMGAEVDEEGQIIDATYEHQEEKKELPPPEPTPPPPPPAEKPKVLFTKQNPNAVKIAKEQLGKALDEKGVERAIELLEGRTFDKPTFLEVIEAVKLEKEIYEVFAN